ncbi:hypothetical protein LHK_03156 [Laribacter hongkongensis HLHK9]|uniref:Uncharacterized protein n=1 Tax=Laribacter hongkongensis (strain HLHK9) TaxID=557598 RepID=C1D699_LARHH|nr:hypothetical protein LHK_03156 [Laribacter hongkongensis HLHK9]
MRVFPWTKTPAILFILHIQALTPVKPPARLLPARAGGR